MAGVSRSKTSNIVYNTHLKSRHLLSILVGLTLGFALSLGFLPLMNICDSSGSLFADTLSSSLIGKFNDETLSLREKLDPFRILNRQARSVVDVTLVDYSSKDYEPKIRPIPGNSSKISAASSHSSSNAKVLRPRYIADELGIREKVLVAVLTEQNHLNTFALFHNQTLQDHVNRLIFFVDDDTESFPKGMQVYAVYDKRKHLKPFYVLKHLAEKMLNDYDWFLIVPSNTFIRGFKLNNFLNGISINQDLYMGQPFDDIHSVYCFFGSGIILSGTILQKIYRELDWCTNNAYSHDLTDNLGRCVLKSAKLPCSDTASNSKFLTYVNYRFEFDTDISKLSKKKDFNQSLTFHPINDMTTMLKLQKYFNQVEINEIKEDVLKYEQMIDNLSCYSSEGCGNTSWPIGVPPPFKPPTRFDVLRWDYFNETHIYLKSDNDVIDVMKGNDYEDIHEVISHSVEKLQNKYGKALKFKKLLNGYRQFDPTRGAHYILDIILIDENRQEYVKRTEIMRPLGLVEIVPMPFVTETTKLFLILPIQQNEQSIVIRFLQLANLTLFDRETRDKFELILAYMTFSKEDYQQSDKWFEKIRQQVDFISQTRMQLKVTFHTIRMPLSSIQSYSQSIYILEYFENKVHSNSLLFITNPYTDMDADFLNRARLNIIENVQIFFPIAFYQYHPDIIRRTHPLANNQTIDLHKAHGWFNFYRFEHVGLYMSDYLNLKKRIMSYNISMSNANLYDLFVQLTDLHIIRAPDHSLRVHYRPTICNITMETNSVEYDRCMMQQEKGVASRSQLAMLIIENEQTKN